MMLLSLGRAELIPLIIAVFGLGIFSFLFLVMLGVLIMRHVVLDLFSRFTRYSKLVSGALILVFAVVYLTPRIPSL